MKAYVVSLNATPQSIVKCIILQKSIVVTSFLNNVSGCHAKVTITFGSQGTVKHTLLKTATSGVLGFVNHMVSALFISFVGILNLRAT